MEAVQTQDMEHLDVNPTGLAFGWATIRAGVLPRWSAISLIAGVVLVAATQGAPEGVLLFAAGMGRW